MTTKFNIKFSPATYDTVNELAGWMDGTMADAVREAITVFAWLAKEYRTGAVLTIEREGSPPTQLVLPSLERIKEAKGVEASGE